jgi:hypothetical protein
VSKGTGTRILTISDHLEWVDYEHHSMALQSKINYYLEYIYSGRLHEAEAESGGKSKRIQLIMRHEPPAEAVRLLEKIEREITRLGFEFVHSVFGED